MISLLQRVNREKTSKKSEKVEETADQAAIRGCGSGGVADEDEARGVWSPAPKGPAGEIDRRANSVIVPFIGEDVRFTKSCRAGEGLLRAKYAQAANAAEERDRSGRAETPVEQPPATEAGSGLLMCLTAVSLAASVLISLTLLWFAFRGIQWLLFR